MRFVVSGKSMEPTFFDGDKLFVIVSFYKSRKPKVGNIVVLKDPREDRQILKRIESINGEEYFVRGDNPQWSTDSREFGAISRQAILGKVLFRYGRG